MEEPSEGPENWIGLQKYMTENLKLEQPTWQGIDEQQSRAAQRPWSEKEYPYIAAWLKLNEKALAMVIGAKKRPRYYNPRGSNNEGDRDGLLMEALLPNMRNCRELSQALTTRAMLRAREGKTADA